MANVKLKTHRASGPLLIRRGGKTYALTAQEDTHIPLRIAAGMLGDDGLLVEFNTEDEKEILSASDYTLELIKSEFSLEGDAKAVQAQDYSLLTVKQLKVILEEKGLSTDGKKADLVERLSAGDE